MCANLFFWVHPVLARAHNPRVILSGMWKGEEGNRAFASNARPHQAACQRPEYGGQARTSPDKPPRRNDG